MAGEKILQSASIWMRAREQIHGENVPSGSSHPSGVQPWAAVVPVSSAWPYHEGDSNPATPRRLQPEAIARLRNVHLLVRSCASKACVHILKHKPSAAVALRAPPPNAIWR